MTTTDTDDAIVVALGNRNAVEVIPDPDDDEDTAAEEGRARNKIRRPLDGKLATTVTIPAGTKLLEAVTTITAGGGVWANHSDAEAPAWVASTDARLAAFLADHYGCELRDYEPSEG